MMFSEMVIGTSFVNIFKIGTILVIIFGIGTISVISPSIYPEN